MPNPVLVRRIGVSGIAIDPIALNWATRVQTNGGVRPSNATILAASNFIIGCKNDGIWSKLISVNMFAPSNLISCLTPLLVGPGMDPWHNQSSSFVAGDLSVNGLTGNSGIPKFLQTGINPATAFSSPTTAGFSVYAYNATATGFNIGAYDGSAKCFMGASKHSDNNAYSYDGASLSNVVTVASPGNGYYSSVRASSTDHRLFFAKTGSPHAQIGATDTTASSTSLPNTGADSCYVFAELFIGSGDQFPCSDTISFVSFFMGFSSTDSANLFSRVQTLRQAFGGGFR